MSKVKIGIPRGTRDFSSEVVRRREYIINTIKRVFELYGFQPLETPSMELLDVLEGKYGEEGNKLMFKIRSNESLREHNKEVDEALNAINYTKWLPRKSDKALRYDLTIPFARYVAMNHGQLTLPFKRYQIQPVWRADRPQKGRYREFYQCDADVVGSTALLNELELANIYKDVFERLRIPVEIRINSRKILAALAKAVQAEDKLTDITVAIDKLDKIGIDKVKEELISRGLNSEQINTITKYLSISGQINELRSIIGDNAGIEEINYIAERFISTKNTELIADFTLARGLNYYTGIIFEVKAKNVQMGSIGGGGRYDDLTGLFGVPNVPGVGISFGVDRIYDVMEELNLFPTEVEQGTKVLFFNLGEKESNAAYKLMQQLRANGIAAELYHENSKMDKQFKYAEKRKVPFIVIIGSRELEQGVAVVKNLETGKQEAVNQDNLSSFFS